MQVQEIKKKGKLLYIEKDHTGAWEFQTKWGRCRYTEWGHLDDGTHDMELCIYLDERTVEGVKYEDIFQIHRVCYGDGRNLIAYGYADNRKIF